MTELSHRTPFGTSRAGRTQKRIAITAAILSFLVGAIGLYSWATRKAPPTIELTDLDPAIANMVTRCRDAVVANPRSGVAWGTLGVALFSYEFKPEAQTCLQEARRLEPKNPRWPYFYGLSLFPDDTATGIEQLRIAIDLHADQDATARNRLGTILAEIGEYDEAEAQFTTVLNRWPDDPNAILGLGKIAAARGQLPSSVTYLHRAITSPFTAKTAAHLLVNVETRLGNVAKARELLETLENLPDDRPLPDAFVEEASVVHTGRRAWIDYATKLYRATRIDEAQPLVERTLRVYPESEEAWILMARIQLRQQNLREAEKSWMRAIELAPQAVEAHVQLGVTLMRQRRPAESARHFLRAIEIKPTLSEAHFNLALACSATQDITAAAKSFREAIRLKPDFPDAYLGLADMVFKLGERDEALRLLDQASQLAPSDARISALRSTFDLAAPNSSPQ